MIYYGDDNTEKITKILMVFLLSVPLLISPAAAWEPQTHQQIVSQVYYSLPLSVQHNLNLNEMKIGAVAPDLVFKDWKNHQYPGSATQAQNWLNKAKLAYIFKNYNYASYCYGVASHYISDSFSAPHGVIGAPYTPHAAYESQATSMTPYIKYCSGSVKGLLSYGYNQGGIDWKLWLKTNNPSITQIDLNHAGSAAYSLIRNYI